MAGGHPTVATNFHFTVNQLGQTSHKIMHIHDITHARHSLCAETLTERKTS